MKKLLIATNAFWISIIVFYACKGINIADDLKQKLNCPSCASYGATVQVSGVSHYGKTEGLNKETALRMASLYQSNCQPVLSSHNLSSGISDSRSIWFSLETIKEFIYNIEKSTCSNSCYDKMQLGIRIYFAQYPDFNGSIFAATSSGNDALVKNDLTSLKNDHPNYSKNHTLFMVPTFDTYLSGNKVHMDFDPWHFGSCSSPTSFSSLPIDTKCMILSPEQPQVGRPEVGGMKTNLDNSLLQNHGNLCPPDDPTGQAF